MSKNIIIKGGAITKLDEISKTRESINRLISLTEDNLENHNNIDSISVALTAIANALSTVDTSNSNINVSNCTFTGLSTGLNIRTAEQEYEVEPVIEEEIDEDLSCEGNEGANNDVCNEEIAECKCEFEDEDNKEVPEQSANGEDSDMGTEI